MTPVIGIPAMGNSLFGRYMKNKYVRSLERAGAAVRWIPPEDLQAAAAAVLECDGLLLPGGADVDPRLYGQEPTETCAKSNVLRDALEPKLLEAFLPTGKPVLCICRGVQMLNVHFGGTLHQDISKMQVCKHADFRNRSKGSHYAKLLPRTKLSEIFGAEPIRVNSMHHQAVDRVGPGLAVSAVSEDGFIEGLEVFLHPFCVGVQWHPEHMSKTDPAQQKLFDIFVEKCRN